MFVENVVSRLESLPATTRLGCADCVLLLLDGDDDDDDELMRATASLSIRPLLLLVLLPLGFPLALFGNEELKIFVSMASLPFAAVATFPFFLAISFLRYSLSNVPINC